MYRDKFRMMVAVVALGSASLATGKISAGEHQANPDNLKIVIAGFNDYSDTPGSVVRFRDLRFARQDAVAMYETFQRYGVPEANMKLFTDQVSQDLATARDVDQYLQDLETDPDDTLIFMFFGHGLNVDQQSYLCFPQTRVEGNPKAGLLVAEKALDLDYLIDLVGEQQAARKVIITDACRNLLGQANNPTLSEKLTRFDLSSVLTRNSDKDVGQGQIVMISSCLPHEICHEDEKLGHGAFTGHMLQGLEGNADFEICGNRDGQLSLYEVFQFAAEKTAKQFGGAGNGQHPFWEGAVTEQIELVALSSDKQEELVSYYNDYYLVRKPLGLKEQQATAFFDQALTSIPSGPNRVIELCTKAIENEPEFSQAFLLRSTMRFIRRDFADAFDDLKEVEDQEFEFKIPNPAGIELTDKKTNRRIGQLVKGTRVRISSVSKEVESEKWPRGKFMLVSHVQRPGNEEWSEQEGWIDMDKLDELSLEESTELIRETQEEIEVPTMTQQESAITQQQIPLTNLASRPNADIAEIINDTSRIIDAVNSFESGNIAGGVQSLMNVPGGGSPFPNAQRLDPNQYIPAPARQFVPNLPGPSSIPYIGSFF